MFGHDHMRFVIDALYFAPILNLANDAPKDNHSTGARLNLVAWRVKLRFLDQNFANQICHMLQLLARVSWRCFELLEKKILK